MIEFQSEKVLKNKIKADYTVYLNNKKNNTYKVLSNKYCDIPKYIAL